MKFEFIHHVTIGQCDHTYTYTLYQISLYMFMSRNEAGNKINRSYVHIETGWATPYLVSICCQRNN